MLSTCLLVSIFFVNVGQETVEKYAPKIFLKKLYFSCTCLFAWPVEKSQLILFSFNNPIQKLTLKGPLRAENIDLLSVFEL